MYLEQVCKCWSILRSKASAKARWPAALVATPEGEEPPGDCGQGRSGICHITASFSLNASSLEGGSQFGWNRSVEQHTSRHSLTQTCTSSKPNIHNEFK
jgi:hypothetical protein